jgi:hypothetical protein
MAADELLARMAAAEARLSRLIDAGADGARTDPDADTGERWEAGQAWGHLAEFVGYWLAQLEKVRDAPEAEPASFGRVKTDEGRLAGIEQGRHADRRALLQTTRARIADARTFIGALDPEQLERIGLHPTRGAMTLAKAFDTFVVSHLEEHAAQLEGLAPA